MSERDTRIDWQLLQRLRETFLNNARNAGIYWSDEWVLRQYHLTFGARIGWKWQSAIADAKQADWKPKASLILDWGCGTGIAALAIIEAFGSDWIDRVLLWDHSVLACRFAKQRILEVAPQLNVETFERNRHHSELKNTLAVASHVINELSPESRTELRQIMADSAQVFWVEPGNHESSRLLVEQRAALLDTHHAIAPCVGCFECPMLREENARHWCHFFAKAPIEAFTDSNWARFGQTMEIDLRSLPYSYLAMDSQRFRDRTPNSEDSRIIGRPKQLKGHHSILTCDNDGLTERELQKRDRKSLWKSVKKGKDGSLYHWTHSAEHRILDGYPIEKHQAERKKA